jgi:hypothetical protein
MRNTGLLATFLTILLAYGSSAYSQCPPNGGAGIPNTHRDGIEYPDAPSVALNVSTAAKPAFGTEKDSFGIQPLPAGRVETHQSDAKYIVVMGAMFASSIVNVEYTHQCLVEHTCSFPPGPLQSRGAMYSTGLSAEIAIAYLSYQLERNGHKWWFLPATLVTTANFYVAHHAASQLR